MCLGIPGLVVERQESGDELASAVVEFAGVRRKVCIACVPESQPGDYVIVHAGIAISRIDPVEAGRVFAFLEESGDRDGWDEGPAGVGEDRP
jgi:hydrogenase expression/formation protein HypC